VESVVSAVAEQQAELVAAAVAGIAVVEAAAVAEVAAVAFEDIDNHSAPAPALASAFEYVEREPWLDLLEGQPAEHPVAALIA